jgi:transposase
LPLRRPREKDVVLFGRHRSRLALAHGPVHEILVHLAPNLLGDGIRLFGSPGAGRNVGRRPLTDLRFRVGRPSFDCGYDHDTYRQLLGERGITPVTTRRGTRHGSGLGRRRWIVERTFAWLHALRWLRIRYERRADTHQGMISLACSISCLRNLATHGDRSGKNPARVCTSHCGSSSQG